MISRHLISQHAGMLCAVALLATSTFVTAVHALEGETGGRASGGDDNSNHSSSNAGNERSTGADGGSGTSNGGSGRSSGSGASGSGSSSAGRGESGTSHSSSGNNGGSRGGSSSAGDTHDSSNDRGYGIDRSTNGYTKGSVSDKAANAARDTINATRNNTVGNLGGFTDPDAPLDKSPRDASSLPGSIGDKSTAIHNPEPGSPQDIVTRGLINDADQSARHQRVTEINNMGAVKTTKADGQAGAQAGNQGANKAGSPATANPATANATPANATPATGKLSDISLGGFASADRTCECTFNAANGDHIPGRWPCDKFNPKLVTQMICNGMKQGRSNLDAHLD